MCHSLLLTSATSRVLFVTRSSTMSKNSFLQNYAIPFLIFGACFLYSYHHNATGRWIFGCIRGLVGYAICHTLWYILDIHGKWGPWKCAEPASHAKFSAQTGWIVLLFVLQNEMLMCLLSIDMNGKSDGKIVFWEFSDKYKYISSTSPGQDIMWGIAGFYMVDFLRYWGHRIGHWSFFFKTFPFSHAHHHNQLFINPLTTMMSPLVHLASWATYTPVFLLGTQGLHRSSIIALTITMIPNLTQHLGFDPFPWLTRWNHYYFYGALPWIPVYHSYHHNPFIKTGNFGNTTVLFDYVFGSLQPECVYHIERGQMMEKVADRFKDEKQLDKVLNSMYKAGNGKNRLDLNENFDSSIFKTHLL